MIVTRGFTGLLITRGFGIATLVQTAQKVFINSFIATQWIANSLIDTVENSLSWITAFVRADGQIMQYNQSNSEINQVIKKDSII